MNAHRRVSQMAASVASDRSHSPVSRTGTPGLHHDPNIAPQHIFDGVALNHDHMYDGSPSLPALHLNQPSPSTLGNDRHLEAPVSYEQLISTNKDLKTRVSELEVINMVYLENEGNLRNERDKALHERDELKRKVDELEQRLREATRQEHPLKKIRLADIKDD